MGSRECGAATFWVQGFSGGNENVLDLDRVTVAQHGEFTKSP